MPMQPEYRPHAPESGMSDLDRYSEVLTLVEKTLTTTTDSEAPQ